MKPLPRIGVMLLAATSLFGAPIMVHNTGVNATDNLVASGAAASFWTLTARPVGASQALGSSPFRYFNGAYVPDTTLAAWVSPGSNGNANTSGFYTYSLNIDLTGLDPNTAIITGRFSTDNDGSIFLNGNPPVATRTFAAFGGFGNFTFNSGFVAGINTINVNVNNGGDPTAFIVEFASATADVANAIPEPSTYAMVFMGLAAAVARRRQTSR